jgi:hypothetical protein
MHRQSKAAKKGATIAVIAMMNTPVPQKFAPSKIDLTPSSSDQKALKAGQGSSLL